MGSITKPILLAVVGILAVVLFLQTSNLITGKLTGQDINLTTLFGAGNEAPTVFDVNFTMVANPTFCANDSTTITCTALVYDPNGNNNVTTVNGTLWAESMPSGETCAAPGDVNLSWCYVNTSCKANTTQTDPRYGVYSCVFDTLTFFAYNGTWNCTVWATDGIATANNQTAYNPGFVSDDTRNAWYGLSTYNVVNFGSGTSGQNLTQNSNVRSCSNRPIDVKANATDMTCTSGTILSTNITASNRTSAFDFRMNSTLQKINTDHALTIQETSSWESNATIYWNLTVPSGVSGNCVGNITLQAVENT